MKKISLLFAMLTMVVGGAWAAVDLTKVADMSTLVNAGSPTSVTHLITQDAYSFDGSTSYVGSIDCSAVKTAYESSNYVTVAAWIYMPSLPTTDGGMSIFSYGENGKGFKFNVRKNGALRLTTKGVQDIDFGGSFSANSWVLVACCVPGSGSSNKGTKGYIGTTDGGCYSKTMTSYWSTPTTTQFAIASGYAASTSEPFSGRIANLTVFTSTDQPNNSDIAGVMGSAPVAKARYCRLNSCWNWNNSTYIKSGNGFYAYQNGTNLKVNSTADAVTNIIKISDAETDGKYTLMTQNGQFVQATTQSAVVTLGSNAVDYYINFINAGSHTLSASNSGYTYLQYANDKVSVKGWECVNPSSTNAQAVQWAITEATGYDFYTVNITAPEGTTPTLTYTPSEGTYAGTAVYDGGFIAVSTGTIIAKSELSCTIDGYATYYDINSADKTITVTFAQYPAAGYYRLKNVKGNHYLSNVKSNTIKTTSDKTASSIYNVTTMEGGYALQSYETGAYLQNPWQIGTDEATYKKAWVLAAGNTTGYFTLYYSEGGHYMTGDGSVTWWTDDAKDENAQWTLEPVMIESRTTTPGSYGTICLPYDATATGAVVMEFQGRSTKGLVFDFPEGKTEETSTVLTAGVPYLYRATTDAPAFTTTGTTYTAAAPSNGFTGVYTAQDVPEGKYFLYTSDNMFHPAGSYVHINAYKCYFDELPTNYIQARSNACVFGIFGDETTGIQGINTSVDLNKEGKFVENGRVVIVKNGQKFNVAGQAVK